MNVFIGMTLALLFLTDSCLQTPAQASPDPIEEYVKGPSLPPAGRSLFDLVIAERSQGTVPFPFDELRAVLAGPRQGIDYEGSLLPRGRSLQRDSSGEFFYMFPRVVFAAREERIKDKVKFDSFDLDGKLFVAYNEPSRQLEIISFNDRASRYEFQIVNDYGEGGTPKVVYANRALCVSCHQSGLPLFSTRPWADTQANPAIRREIALAVGKDSHLGVDLNHLPGVGMDPEIAAGRMEGQAFLASEVLFSRAKWNEGCDYGDDVEQTYLCRRWLLNQAGRTSRSGTLQFRPIERLSADLGRPFSLPETGLVSPLVPDSPRTTAEDLSRALRQNVASGDADPLALRPLISQARLNSLSPHTPFGNADFQRLFAILNKSGLSLSEKSAFLGNIFDDLLDDALAGESRAVEVFSKPYSRQALLSEVARRAGIEESVQSICCDLDTEKSLPPPVLDGEDDPKNPSGDFRLLPFKTFCADCHRSAGSTTPPDLFSGDDSFVKERLLFYKDDIIKLLDGSDTDQEAVMPPRRSRQFSELSLPENRSKRMEMKISLEGSFR